MLVGTNHVSMFETIGVLTLAAALAVRHYSPVDAASSGSIDCDGLQGYPTRLHRTHTQCVKLHLTRKHGLYRCAASIQRSANPLA